MQVVSKRGHVPGYVIILKLRGTPGLKLPSCLLASEAHLLVLDVVYWTNIALNTTYM